MLVTFIIGQCFTINLGLRRHLETAKEILAEEMYPVSKLRCHIERNWKPSSVVMTGQTSNIDTLEHAYTLLQERFNLLLTKQR